MIARAASIDPSNFDDVTAVVIRLRGVLLPSALEAPPVRLSPSSRLAARTAERSRAQVAPEPEPEPERKPEATPPKGRLDGIKTAPSALPHDHGITPEDEKEDEQHRKQLAHFKARPALSAAPAPPRRPRRPG